MILAACALPPPQRRFSTNASSVANGFVSLWPFNARHLRARSHSERDEDRFRTTSAAVVVVVKALTFRSAGGPGLHARHRVPQTHDVAASVFRRDALVVVVRARLPAAVVAASVAKR